MYMIFDELKISSDDSYWNESHIAFLINKFRNILLKQKYANERKEIPDRSYQEICLTIDWKEDCLRGTFVSSNEQIPYFLNLGDNYSRYDIYPDGDYLNNKEWTLTSIDRLRYVGNNKWLNKIIYFAVSPDRKLYLNSGNVDYKYLKKVKINGIFDDPIEANKLSCNNNSLIGEECDEYDFEYPINEELVPTLIEMIIQHLSPAIYKPEDKENNSDDDLSDLTTQKDN